MGLFIVQYYYCNEKYRKNEEARLSGELPQQPTRRIPRRFVGGNFYFFSSKDYLYIFYVFYFFRIYKLYLALISSPEYCYFRGQFRVRIIKYYIHINMYNYIITIGEKKKI